MELPIILKAFGDNFIYIVEYETGKAFVVDPGEASGVLRKLGEYKLNLTHILCTHHHSDHTGGIGQLKKASGCKIVASDAGRILGADCIIQDGDELKLGSLEIQAIFTPGHTARSVCYYARQTTADGKGMVFTGDTLFVGGCGRLFECSAEVMWESLQRLASLPDETLVYCGHEYTAENYEFALQIEPDNNVVRERMKEIKNMQRNSGYTVPSTIGQEKLTNCFLRADSVEIRSALEMADAPVAEVFAELRKRKDRF